MKKQITFGTRTAQIIAKETKQLNDPYTEENLLNREDGELSDLELELLGSYDELGRCIEEVKHWEQQKIWAEMDVQRIKDILHNKQSTNLFHG
jgi:hypothetical protein